MRESIDIEIKRNPSYERSARKWKAEAEADDILFSLAHEWLLEEPWSNIKKIQRKIILRFSSLCSLLDSPDVRHMLFQQPITALSPPGT